MRIVRFMQALEARYGVLEGAVVHALEGGFEAPRRGAALCGLDEVTLLAPCEPQQVISVGANYADRCHENELQVPTAPAIHDSFHMAGEGVVVGSEAPLRLPPWENHVEYGGELGVVIGRDCHRVGVAAVGEHILGYTCLNNLWAKTRPRVPGALNIRIYDRFCPLGPWIETELDTSDLRLSLRVDGEVRQDSRTAAMLFDVRTVVALIAGHVKLRAGDVIMTGTPAGVRPLHAGEVVEIEIEGLGVLRNPAVADPSPVRRTLRRMSR
jgi:2-keto-4-pentenoate hydratase/2-oxohepta-3-ene-1,7-dioic acid hydratase in catechol pathway